MGMIQKHAEAAYFCAPVVAIGQIIADRQMWAAGVKWPWQTVGRQLQQHPLVRAFGPKLCQLSGCVFRWICHYHTLSKLWDHYMCGWGHLFPKYTVWCPFSLSWAIAIAHSLDNSPWRAKCHFISICEFDVVNSVDVVGFSWEFGVQSPALQLEASHYLIWHDYLIRRECKSGVCLSFSWKWGTLLLGFLVHLARCNQQSVMWWTSFTSWQQTLCGFWQLIPM